MPAKRKAFSLEYKKVSGALLFNDELFSCDVFPDIKNAGQI